MPPTPEPACRLVPSPEAERAAALVRALRALPLHVDDIRVAVDAIAVPSYPGGPRPSSTVTLAGDGREGHGEHVGWTPEAHLAFRSRTREILPGPTRTTVGDLSKRLGRLTDAYDRAALEAAAIDLALRQAGLGLGDLISATPRPPRYVVSFVPGRDPLRDLDSIVGPTPGIEAKIDVDPSRSIDLFERLAATGRVAIFDWKRSGNGSFLEEVGLRVGRGLFEDAGSDPLHPPAGLASRCSVDAPFVSARALEEAPPAAANVKPARMGGVLEALDGVAWCAERRIAVYFGGMFEVGPGRRQLRDLAALLAPDAPNDIAPIARATEAAPRPIRLPLGPPEGFGRRVEPSPTRTE